MLRATLLFGLAATVLARAGNLGHNVQNIRFANVDASLTGLLVPVAGAPADDVPTYEFRSAVNGAPIAENDHYSYRCGVIEGYYVPYAKNQRPALFCRNVDFERGVPAAPDAARASFVLSADQLPPQIKTINLLFGKSTYHNFVAANPSASSTFDLAGPYGAGNARIRDVSSPYDGYRVVSSSHPYYSIVEPSSEVSNVRGSEQHLIQAARRHPLPLTS